MKNHGNDKSLFTTTSLEMPTAQCAYQARHPGCEALFKYDLPNSFVAFLGLICAIGGTSRPCFPDFSLLEAAVTLL